MLCSHSCVLRSFYWLQHSLNMYCKYLAWMTFRRGKVISSDAWFKLNSTLVISNTKQTNKHTCVQTRPYFSAWLDFSVPFVKLLQILHFVFCCHFFMRWIWQLECRSCWCCQLLLRYTPRLYSAITNREPKRTQFGVFAILEYCAASVRSRLPTFRHNVPVSSSTVKLLSPVSSEPLLVSRARHSMPFSLFPL